MEKKTIGKFISALRRASGMTQKELGEKLFVSDKTVSRWERDECTPELSLIPAIAEIFGVTTDELLRGERNTQQAEVTVGQKGRSDRQFKLMLHNKMVKFRNLSLISVGIAMVGLIVGAIIDLSFSRGVLGCGIATAFILAGTICQLCFASSGLLRLDEDEECYHQDILQANSKVTRTTVGVLMIILTIFAIILPMGLFTAGGYTGLSFGSWMLLGSLFAGITLIVTYVLYILWIRKTLVSKGLIYEDARLAEESAAVRKLLKKMLVIAFAIFAVLVVVFVIAGSAGTRAFAESVTFYDMEEFKEFTRQAALEERENERYGWADITIEPESGVVSTDGEVIEGAIRTDYLKDENGNILAEYYSGAVSALSWSADEATGEVEWVTVYTVSAMRQGSRIYSAIYNILLCLMALDFAVCAVVYVVRLHKKKH